jgi:hypothetical protein
MGILDGRQNEKYKLYLKKKINSSNNIQTEEIQW